MNKTFIVSFSSSKVEAFQAFHFHVYKSILVFRHISRSREAEKVTVSCFLFLFLLGMGQEKALTASMHGWILSPN